MIYWFFGLPGVGKDHCARRLSELLECAYIDADGYLTEEYRQALLGGSFTAAQRHEKLARISDDIERLIKVKRHVAVADSLPDEASRKLLMQRFGDQLQLILVKAASPLHKKRLEARQNHFFTADLLDNYASQHWQPPEQIHSVIINENPKELEEQLRAIVAQLN